MCCKRNKGLMCKQYCRLCRFEPSALTSWFNMAKLIFFKLIIKGTRYILEPLKPSYLECTFEVYYKYVCYFTFYKCFVAWLNSLLLRNVTALSYCDLPISEQTLCFHLGMTESFIWDYGTAQARETDWSETSALLQEIHQEFVKDNGAIQYSHKVNFNENQKMCFSIK